MRFHLPTIAAAGLILAGGVSAASAKEYPIGEAKTVQGMELGAVYLQPIEMDPPDVMRPAADSDVHLEADIHAVKDNATGFPEGEWLPYLVVKYKLSKVGTTETLSGDLMPMVANDGPHYGDNVKMMGAGKYELELTILPPTANAHAHFGRHVDKETGVGPWFTPITVDYDFTYAGVGKKGGY
ncbi:MAG: iron transporter [Azospirillaceae bacterium]|nr:iron transporter [Azospirillaceae bacterium]